MAKGLTHTPRTSYRGPARSRLGNSQSTPSGDPWQKTDPRRRVLVVRPYERRLRDQVFGLLTQAGCVINENDIIPKGTSDAESVERVLASPCEILLVPFHAHHTRGGQLLDGLRFLRELEQRVERFRWSAVMPVSRLAQASVTLAFDTYDPKRSLSEATRSRVLFVDEEELDEPSLVDQIRSHTSTDSWIPESNVG